MAYQHPQDSQDFRHFQGSHDTSGADPEMANTANTANNSSDQPDTLSGEQGAHTMLLRIQRGAVALGTDGELGSVQQIVVDRDTGELRALVVRQTNAGSGETHELEIPVSHIQQASGTQVQLDIGQADLRAHPELAHTYNPDDYTPVYQGTVAQEAQAQRVAASTEHPVVTEVERDAAAVIMPDTQTQTTPAMEAVSQPAQPAATSGSRGVDMPITPATPITEPQAPLDGPAISSSAASLPEYGVDSTLPQRPGAEAIGASATTPASDIPPMVVPTPDNVVIVPPQADAPEPMGATPNLAATDTSATDFTPAQPAQLDDMQPVLLGGLSTPIPPTRQLPEPPSRSRFAFSPVVVALLGGVGLLVATVWLTSRIKRAGRSVEHAVERTVGDKRARAQLQRKAQRTARKTQRQGMNAAQRAMQISQRTAQQALESGKQATQQAVETGKQTTRQLTRQALDMASGWRDNLSRQAPGVASSLAESSQNAASRAREKAAQLSAQAQGMARENMSRMPQRMGTLRSSTGATWSRARKAATLAPERARWFRRGFRVGARVGAVGGVAAARVNAWRDNAPWANRPQTPTTATNTATTQPEPLVVKTTIRPRRIVLFRRQTDVPTDVTP